ncbi:hypothetical protein SAMN04515671_0304 [Nakamurella panacisegetis]|uniref:Glycoside hydrolase family 127 protein n=1 Tax=Nakamurella panacisegetis TaxID=1090615 RepID=A0A1H0I0Z9_9ACTN|nr:beta-L-arabinofuranosidase domain-containing protein [Nakamurella panacisegetis]SDO25073.1 hypothetical protein SAMN04515671_0304 [Nakamurella panacisegetis]
MTALPNSRGFGPIATTMTPLRPLPHQDVTLTPDGWLGRWQLVNRAATIGHCIAQLETSGAVENLRIAAGESEKSFQGMFFTDSDIYKVLEAIGWEAGRSDITEFLPFVDATVALLQRAQAQDGYLNSYVQAVKPAERFGDLRWGHELYCLGHLLQAGIAWERTQGRADLLEIGRRFADLVAKRFADEPFICGHPEVETALVELYRTTGEPSYLDLARDMVDLSGHQLIGEDRFGYPYFQDHLPVREVTEATGHAVRQVYLTTAMADLRAELDDRSLDAPLERLWDSVHRRKMYISGGLGARHRDESFGDSYELPPDRAYSETCAAIANFMWNARMLLATGEGRFADEMERGLYNGIAVATSVEGTEFFYSNPLQLRSDHDGSDEDAPSSRLPWYTCACCPPNLARLISSVHDYLVTTDGDGLQIHLYADGDITLDGRFGATRAAVRTGYPFDGRIEIGFDHRFTGTLLLRVPAWADGQRVVVDGVVVTPDRTDHGYLRITGGADTVVFTLPLPISVVHPHPHVDASRGCVAVTRGPVLYALEQTDLPDGITIEDVLVPATPEVRPGGTDDHLMATVLTLAGGRVRQRPDELYSTTPASSAGSGEVELRLIPYYRWGNRGGGGMRVWLPTT